MVQHLRLAGRIALFALIILFAASICAFAQEKYSSSRGSTPIEAVNGSISGTVFVDADGNAEHDAGEQGIGDVALICELLHADGSITFTSSTRSNADGFYTVSGLDAGRYRIVATGTAVSTARLAPSAVVEITADTQNVVGSLSSKTFSPSITKQRTISPLQIQ